MAGLLDSLGSYPPYFLRLAEINRHGPVLDREPALQPLAAADVSRLLADDAMAVDVRPVPEYAAGHIPGALSIPFRPALASWLGWLAPPDRPLIIVHSTHQQPAEIAWQAAKIGYDNLAGAIDGGMAAWAASGQPVIRTKLARPNEIASRRVLDVRQDSEFAAGHLPGATHIELGDLPDRSAELPDEPTVVMCGARRARGRQRQPARTSRSHRRDRARRRAGRLGTRHRSQPRVRHGHQHVLQFWDCGPTSPSSACWSRSTRWSEACSARSAPCCRCWPETSSA